MSAPLTRSTADAYALALAAARAALDAPDGREAPAARSVVDGVADVEELRRVVGALAFLAAKAVPRRVRRGESVRSVLDAYAAEVAWRAS